MSQWNPRANEIFATAADLPRVQRQAYLQEACGADGELRREVEELLAAHEDAGDFLGLPAGAHLFDVRALPTTPPDSGPPLPAGAGVVRALGGDLPPVRLRQLDGETLPTPSQVDLQKDAPDLPDRYRMQGEIARGGMGCVLKGHDAELGRDVAVKVLLETHQGRTELVQRFVEEAQIAGQLQHPGIVPVYEMGGKQGKRPYFTMKLVKGQTLSKLLAQRRDPDQERARFLKVFEQVCQTLAYAHARGVIHRDLKPANVMVGAFGEVQVMDWGLAKILTGPERQPSEEPQEPTSVIATVRSSGSESDSGHTQAGTALGTPSYVAPEQARGEVDRVDERADVFGLGALLCEILTGQPPFPGRNAEAMRLAQKGDLSGAFARLDGRGADAELVTLAKRCLAAEPDDRPRHAGEVAEGMTSYLESVETRLRQAELQRAQAQVKAAEERKRRKLTLALAASMLLTVVLGGGGYAWLQHQHSEQRAVRAKAIDAALYRVAVLRGKAAIAPLGDLSGWGEAQSEMKHAEDLLDQGDVHPTLRVRVAAVRDELERDCDEAERRAQDAVAERKLLARLESISAKRCDPWEPKRIDEEYADAFRAFGVDLDVGDPQEAGAKLAGRPGTVEIVAALGEWCRLRRDNLAENKDVRPWQRLAEVARLADPDPWRNRLRETFDRPREAAEVLKKQAGDVAALERQPAASLVLLARLLAQAGERKSGVEVLRLAWQRFPGDFWVNFELANALQRGGGDELEILRFRTAAVVARPGSAMAHYNLGATLCNQKRDHDGGIAALRRALDLDPKHALAHSGLGDALRKQGKVDEGIVWLQKAIALDPRNAHAHNNLGAALYDLGKEAEAITAFQKAIKLAPMDANPHHNLGLALYKQGKVDKAIACFRKAILLDTKVANAHRVLGIALNSQGKVDEAITSFRQAIKVDPRDADAHNSLGFALDKQGKVDEALAAFQEAIKLAPNLATARIGLGLALMSKGKVDEAVAAFREVLELTPNDADAHHNLGVALLGQGKVDEAIASFRAAIKVDRNRAKTHTILGIALARKGEAEEAIACYRTAIALDPKSAEVHTNLGIALKKQGKVDEAVTAFRQAIKIDPKDAEAHFRLGDALMRKGQFAEAIASFREAIKHDPKHARAHGILSMALLQQGEFAEAEASILRCQELLPPKSKSAGDSFVSEQLQICRHLLALEKKLPDVLAGKFQPADTDELSEFAHVCKLTKRYRAASLLYVQILASDPKLADDHQAGHRYNAACAAALAGTGKGNDAGNIGGNERLRWRRQALTWLRADLALLTRLVVSGEVGRSRMTRALAHWQKDSDLASLRDKEALSNLSAEERQACERLWADVAALLKQSEPKAK